MVRAALPTVAKVLGTLGLAGATGAVTGAAHKATSGRGLSVIIPESDIKMIVHSINELEKNEKVPNGTTEMCICHLKEQKGGFIGTLLASLAGMLIPSLLGGKGLYRAGNPPTKGIGLYRVGGQVKKKS